MNNRLQTIENSLKCRYRAEFWFRSLGKLAVCLVFLFLFFLLFSIISRSYSAFWRTALVVPLIEKSGKKAPLSSGTAVLKATLSGLFPDITEKKEKRDLMALISSEGLEHISALLEKNRGEVNKNTAIALPLEANADLYIKGQTPPIQTWKGQGMVVPDQTEGTITLFSTTPHDFAPLVQKRLGLKPGEPLFLLLNEGVVLLDTITDDTLSGMALVPLSSLAPAPSSRWQITGIAGQESERKLSNQQIAWLESLRLRGVLDTSFNWRFFTSGDSRDPERAGILGAIVGSLLMMLVTGIFCVPTGIATAIYLEEFAPKNLWTEWIEVNIQNLAAVPSIIFGLLGLSVFLNWFGMPRSSPFVGGMVLALLVLPTIIVTARSALKAVPSSIRQAALAIGASEQQAVFHHILPLAMPGIMTGVIIGMAHALGETAPLLMIGMVAFIVDIPHTVLDASSALPVQIFLWSDLPEPGFQAKTSAAIVVLLLFLFVMNAGAIFLRKRFEKKW